jgi:hypothetical protein
LLLIVIAAAIGMLDNWIRVFALVMIAHVSNMQSPLVYSHASFGWWVYAASLVPLFMIARRLERGESHEAPSLVESWRKAFPISGAVNAIVLALLVVVGQLAANGLMHRVGSARAGLAMPGKAQSAAPLFRPRYPGFDIEQAWTLHDAANTYELLALTYLRQEREKKLIFYRNVIADEDDLRSTTRIETRAGVPMNFSVVRGATWHLVWWFYWVDGSITASPMKAKLLQLKAMLFGDPSAALVTLSRPCAVAGCQVELGEASPEQMEPLLARAAQLRVAQ